MSRTWLGLVGALVITLSACGDDPLPGLEDRSISRGQDAGRLDLGLWPDAEADSGLPADSGVHPDAEPADSGVHPDAEPADSGVHPDAEPADSGVHPDAAPSDSGVHPDAAPADTGPVDTGVPVVPDADGDGISDADEGNGTVDTDGDGTPDSQDADSDGDGIPDSVEAGDLDPATPPRDTDGDGTPDFRDTDSDGDGIPDAVEGVVDPDNDGLPAYRDVDSDGDGLLDAFEGTADPDGDTIPNFLDIDSDGDTIRDDAEGTADPDGDMIASWLDPDSDGDGVPDAVEAGDANPATPPVDTDFDQIPDYLDLDSDNDTISDQHEGTADSDGDSFPDRIDIDSDDDSLLDNLEAGDADLGTPPVDSDMDGMPDYRDTDSDGDTIIDLTEGNVDTDGDMVPDRLDLDSDGDGWTDAQEAGDTDPLTAPVDTDGDNRPDFRDLDSDADGLADRVELGCGMASTERALADSDGDGFVDPAEQAYGSNPCDRASGIDDFYFVLPPNGPGARAPLTFTNTAIDRADFAINVDTTGSMEGEIANIRSTLSTTIIPGVAAVIPDAAFGVASFDDFPIEPFGFAQAGDLPFRLGSRITRDPMVAQAAVNGLTTQVGADFPESGMEALYQIATGAGVTWPGGSVAAFNPALNRVPGVADGTIGGVGFRGDSLPVVVHVTDAISHTRADYQRVNTGIAAASTPQVRAALDGIGARVVTISSGFRPYNDFVCQHRTTTFFGAITPVGLDVDWFVIPGAAAGDTLSVELFAARASSDLNTRVAIANATGIIAQNDDLSGTNPDSRLTATLSGPAPYYVVVTDSADTALTGMVGTTAGHYLMDVELNGNGLMPSPSQCRAEDANTRTNATPLVTFAQSQPAASVAQCLADCETILGPLSPLFSDFTYPYEMSEDTGAVVPACAWSQFGPGRPAGCAANQCCTGLSGAGVSPSFAGACPLSFQIDSSGVGIDAAMVAGIEALVRFSTFDVTTVVRPDPAELARSGLDTTCFIHGVTPTTAVPPNSCAPQPRTADLVPPSPDLDSFVSVVPGTQLSFDVQALNQQRGTMTPCAPSIVTPQLFRAFIDVIADGVTVLDTRDVIIIVPPTAPGGSN